MARRDPRMDLLIRRAGTMSREGIDWRLVAKELIRLADGDLALLQKVHEEAARRYVELGGGRGIGHVLGPVHEAIRSLKAEEAGERERGNGTVARR